MKTSIVSAVALAATISVSSAAIAEHEITSLPGWSGKALPSKMYSGYIDVGKTSGSKGKIHYWFITSQSKTASSDPVVYWTNGGPGGSGINAGLLTEMGALQLNENSMTAKGIELD